MGQDLTARHIDRDVFDTHAFQYLAIRWVYKSVSALYLKYSAAVVHTHTAEHLSYYFASLGFVYFWLKCSVKNIL